MIEPQGYRSYLLRLWRVPGEEIATWRASLESPYTGERRGFAGLEELVAFLRRQMDLTPIPWGEAAFRDEG
jgi:hypothetical protein